MYNRDFGIIAKLKLNAEGKYNRFSQGDIEYIIQAIRECNRLETVLKLQKENFANERV